jgi:hypothetical protein
MKFRDGGPTRNGFKTSNQVPRLKAGFHARLFIIKVFNEARRKPSGKAQQPWGCEHLPQGLGKGPEALPATQPLSLLSSLNGLSIRCETPLY